MPYSFQEFHIRDQMLEGIHRYIKNGIAPGDFLTAVIQNNLSEACVRADHKNLQNLPAYAAYFYNEAPLACHGSKEKMDVWITKKRGEL